MLSCVRSREKREVFGEESLFISRGLRWSLRRSIERIKRFEIEIVIGEKRISTDKRGIHKLKTVEGRILDSVFQGKTGNQELEIQEILVYTRELFYDSLIIVIFNFFPSLPPPFVNFNMKKIHRKKKRNYSNDFNRGDRWNEVLIH